MSFPIERRARPRTDPVRSAHHDAVFALARASETHDEDTGNHVLRIRNVVERIALEMGFDTEDAEALGYDAMLHDVGKLMIPASILRKPTPLTAAEQTIMRRHTIEGERLLADRPSLARAAIIARSHHECFDGSGYPDGLAGEAIPLAARITAVADVLDALMSSRPYKDAWTPDRAVAEIERLSPSQLDPDVVRALKRATERLSD